MCYGETGTFKFVSHVISANGDRVYSASNLWSADLPVVATGAASFISIVTITQQFYGAQTITHVTLLIIFCMDIDLRCRFSFVGGHSSYVHGLWIRRKFGGRARDRVCDFLFSDHNLKN